MKPQLNSFLSKCLLSPLIYILALLFYFGESNLVAQKIIYNNGKLEITGIPDTIGTGTSGKYGTFFWEFGDGEYAKTGRPQYKYLGSNRQSKRNVSVLLVPHYTAVAKPLLLPSDIIIPKGPQRPAYSMNGNLVHIVTSGNKEVVPGHDMRVALHYKLNNSTSSDGGYLAFFYNKKSEIETDFNISFDPFIKMSKYLFYSQERSLTKAESVSFNQSQFVALANLYKNVQVFKTTKMRPNEERKLFFNIASDGKLKDKTGEIKGQLSFEALWIPNINGKVYRHNYKMDVLSVHDPNILKVSPEMAYFKKNDKQTFKYTLVFENEDDGIVKNAKIRLDLRNGVNKSSIYDIKALSYGDLTWKMDCSDSELNKEIRCFRIDTTSNKDSIYFTFHNIDLKKNSFFTFGKNKGYLEFFIESDSCAVMTEARAHIKFDGAKEEKTDPAKVKWKQRGIFVNAGYNFSATAKEYTFLRNSMSDAISLGLSYQNAPIGKGMSYGFSVGYNAYRMERISDSSQLNTMGTILKQTENIKLNLGEFQAFIGYQWGQYFKIYGGSGFSLPVSSKVDLDADILEPGMAVENTHGVGDFGLFSSKPDPSFYGNDVVMNSFIGYVGSFGFEIGALNIVHVGFKYEYRYFPKFYYDGSPCVPIKSCNLYARFRLFAI